MTRDHTPRARAVFDPPDAQGPQHDHDPQPVRLAASLLVIREGHAAPQTGDIMMGRRAGKAAFMPDKLVFPGGAVDAQDWSSPAVDPPCAPGDVAVIEKHLAHVPPRALVRAAYREFREETGLAPPLTITPRLVYRAITPPGRTRRFDAWFFAVKLDQETCQNVCRPDGELSEVGWWPLARIKADPLAAVTRLVVEEVEARLAEPLADRPALFLREEHRAHRITALSSP